MAYAIHGDMIIINGINYKRVKMYDQIEALRLSAEAVKALKFGMKLFAHEVRSGYVECQVQVPPSTVPGKTYLISVPQCVRGTVLYDMNNKPAGIFAGSFCVLSQFGEPVYC